MGASGMVGNIRSITSLIGRVGRMASGAVQKDLLARVRDVLRSTPAPIRVNSGRAKRSAARFGGGAKFGGRSRRTDASRRAFSVSLRKAAAQALSSLKR